MGITFSRNSSPRPPRSGIPHAGPMRLHAARHRGGTNNRQNNQRSSTTSTTPRKPGPTVTPSTASPPQERHPFGEPLIDTPTVFPRCPTAQQRIHHYGRVVFFPSVQQLVFLENRTTCLFFIGVCHGALRLHLKATRGKQVPNDLPGKPGCWQIQQAKEPSSATSIVLVPRFLDPRQCRWCLWARRKTVPEPAQCVREDGRGGQSKRL